MSADGVALTDAAYWSDVYDGQSDFADASDHAVAGFLRKFLVAPAASASSLEIGSYPGAFQPTLGRLGYTLHGLDFNKRNSELSVVLAKNGLDVGSFEVADFFSWVNTHPRKYDLVCSFGFIEHFANFEEVILLHANLVKPGGHLIITTPNFKGWMQHLPHAIFDSANLAKHYLPSMSPEKWRQALSNAGFDIVFAGHFAGYQFWVDPKQHRSSLQRSFLRLTMRGISVLNKVFRFMNLESSAFSAFCGVVARRKQ